MPLFRRLDDLFDVLVEKLRDIGDIQVQKTGCYNRNSIFPGNAP